MGCDIHCYVEYTNKKDDDATSEWRSFLPRVNPGRDYLLFANIAGVRVDNINPVVELRGVPEDAGWRAKWDNYYIINDEDAERCEDHDENRYVRLATAKEWESYGYSKIVYGTGKSDPYIQSPDHHSHTWLTVDELEEALNRTDNHPERSKSLGFGKVDAEYRALVAAMRVLEENGFRTRMVIWFDN
jgi:hypothetical protein